VTPKDPGGALLTDARSIDAPGWAVPVDNVLDLLPREAVHIPIEWRAAPKTDRTLRLEGWNLRVRDIA
jgi:beta-mannosidase